MNAYVCSKTRREALYHRIQNIIQRRLDHGHLHLLKPWLHRALSSILLISSRHHHRPRHDLKTFIPSTGWPRVIRTASIPPTHCNVAASQIPRTIHTRPPLILEVCSTGSSLDVRTINVALFAENQRSRHAQQFVPVLFLSNRQDPGKRLKQLCVGIHV